MHFVKIFAISFLSLAAKVLAQDDFIRMMMLSQLLGGGGFGGGAQQPAAQYPQASMTGFEGDPRSVNAAGGASAGGGGGPGGGLLGLMGLLSRNNGGSAPLLLDVDGDRFMHQLWQQRGGSAGPGAGGPNSVSINNSPGGASSPLSSGSGLSANHRAADGRAKSQPHIAYPYNLDFTGSAANPAPVEAAADARVIPATGP